MHAVDDALPVSEIEFDGHVTHKLAPAVDEYEPAWHSLQPSEPDAAVYFPAEHVSQEPEPLTALCVPGEHAEQPPERGSYPALQTQFDSEVLLVGDVEYTGHDAHATEPSWLAYLPATQLTHVPLPLSLFIFPCAHAVQPLPTSPVYPATQTHWSRERLPCGEMVICGHFVHDPGELPPQPVRYEPASQLEVHAAQEPCDVLSQPTTYCPAGQTGQAEHDPKCGRWRSGRGAVKVRQQSAHTRNSTMTRT